MRQYGLWRRRRSACARAKAASPQVRGPALAAEPTCRARQATCQQIDVESQARVTLVTHFLLGREQVEQKGAKPAFHELVGDVTIAGAEPAAAAAVGKLHDASCVAGQHDVALQHRIAGVDGCWK